MKWFFNKKKTPRDEELRLTIGPIAKGKMDELCKHLRIRSKLRLIRIALTVLDKLVTEKQKGSRIVIETITKDGVTFTNLEI